MAHGLQCTYKFNGIFCSLKVWNREIRFSYYTVDVDKWIKYEPHQNSEKAIATWVATPSIPFEVLSSFRWRCKRIHCCILNIGWCIYKISFWWMFLALLWSEPWLYGHIRGIPVIGELDLVRTNDHQLALKFYTLFVCLPY